MACPGFKYDEAAFMISALVDNRAVVIYPTGKGGVEGPIVYTADPTSCRGAPHLTSERVGSTTPRLHQRVRLAILYRIDTWYVF